MREENNREKKLGVYQASYELRPLILFGSVASGSVIFSVLFVIFLGSQVSSHQGLSTDTISEMMGYAEFFLFAFGSYLLIALLILWRKEYLSRIIASWLPIATFGSFLFSYSFLFRSWASAVLTYKEGDPFQQRPGSFISFLSISLFVAAILSSITVITCYVAAYVSRSTKSNNELVQITQKY